METTHDDNLRNLGNRILILWIVLYGFVGTQMTWRLSPFIGKPEDPFYLIRPSRDNFYVDVIHAIQEAFNIVPSNTDFITPILMGAVCLAGFAGLFFVFSMFLGKASHKKLAVEQK